MTIAHVRQRTAWERDGRCRVVALSVLTHVVGGGISSVSGIGRPVLFAAFGALALLGRNWARVLLALWCGGLALFNVIAAVNLVRSGHAGGAVPFLGLAALFGVALLLLRRARVATVTAARATGDTQAAGRR